MNRFCGRTSVCPFCHARKVTRLYIEIEQRLRSIGVLGGRYLLVFPTPVTWDFDPEVTDPDRMRSHMVDLGKWRQTVVRRARPDGALFNTVFSCSSTDRCFTATTRVMFVVADDWEYKTWPGLSSYVMEERPVNTRTLSTSIGELMRFPAHLVKMQADPELIWKSINLVVGSNFRFTEKAGCLRARRTSGPTTQNDEADVPPEDLPDGEEKSEMPEREEPQLQPVPGVLAGGA